MPPQPSGKAVKKAGKAQKAVRASDKKKKKKRRKESFSIYIYKVCFSLHWISLDGVTNFLVLIIYYSCRFWNRFILTLESLPRPCPSWTPSWMTSSRESLLKPQDSPTTTRDPRLLLEKSKLQSDCCFPENWQNMQCLREQRLLPNTLLPSKSLDECNGSFRRHFSLQQTALLRATNFIALGRDHYLNLLTSISIRSSFNFLSFIQL